MTDSRLARCPAGGAVALRRWLLVLPGAIAMVVAGCSNPKHPMINEETQFEVSNIELKDLSDKPPVSIEEVPVEAVRPDPEPEPPPDRLELEVFEVRKAALEYNLDLRIELVNPTIAREAVLEEEARFESAFFGRVSGGERDPLTVPPVTAPRFASGQTEFGFSLPLRTGGNVVVSLPVSGTEGVVPGSHNIYDSELKFSVSQPLLRDAGIQVNTAPITIAKLRSRQQDARTKGSAINILADAETAYWNLYATERARNVRYQQYQRALEQERQARRLFDEGVVAQIEVTRASAGVASRVQDVISAENSRRRSERNLKRIMNIPNLGMATPTTLFTTTLPHPVALEIDEQRMAELAVGNRMELLEIELQLAIDAITVDIAKNETKPTLDIDYNFSFLGRDNTLGKSLGIVADGNFTDWRVGAQLELPIGNKAAKSRLRQTMLRRVLTLDTRDQRRLFIHQEVYDALDQLDTSWQQILAAREAVLLQARAYKGEQRQFLAGVRTSTDVLIAETALADAELREVQALASYEVAKIDVAVASGTLLGMGRVELTRRAARVGGGRGREGTGPRVPGVGTREDRVTRRDHVGCDQAPGESRHRPHCPRFGRYGARGRGGRGYRRGSGWCRECGLRGGARDSSGRAFRGGWCRPVLAVHLARRPGPLSFHAAGARWGERGSRAPVPPRVRAHRPRRLFRGAGRQPDVLRRRLRCLPGSGGRAACDRGLAGDTPGCTTLGAIYPRRRRRPGADRRSRPGGASGTLRDRTEFIEGFEVLLYLGMTIRWCRCRLCTPATDCRTACDVNERLGRGEKP